MIATIDGEIDDRCSMVRFLLYANEWDIEGIIYSSSEFHWKGYKWAGETWIERDIDLYAQCYDRLKEHASGFPSPRQLKEVTLIGNIDYVGEMEKETPGSEHIVKVLLDSKPGPVYLQAWGGTNTIARALKTIQEKHPEEMARVSAKAVLYIILDQDQTLEQYILPNWPDLQVLGSFVQFRCIAYYWDKKMPAEVHRFFQAPWMKENILQRHGSLCTSYEAHGKDSRQGLGDGDDRALGDGNFRAEGDSPAFMHQIDVGLRSMEHPSYGGWGGRFVKDQRGEFEWRGHIRRDKRGKNVWRDAADDGLSRPGEFHPQPLREPDVNLSAHPAPITRTTREYAKLPVDE